MLGEPGRKTCPRCESRNGLIPVPHPKGYAVAIYKPCDHLPPVTIQTLEERVKALEEKVKELERTRPSYGADTHSL